MRLNDLLRVAHSGLAGHRYLAVLIAYLDDSGTQDDGPVFAVGGWVASASQWFILELEWRKILASEGVTRFRASELENGKGEFADWKKDRRIDFQCRLADALGKWSQAGVGRGVPVAEFRDILRPGDMFVQGVPGVREFLPLIFCLRLCLEWIGWDWPQRPKDEKVSVVFESGTKGLGAAGDYYDWLMEHSSLGDVFDGFVRRPKWLPGLQAADMLAYETYKAIGNGETRPRRRILDRLGSYGGISIMSGGRDGFLRLVDDFNKWIAETGKPEGFNEP